MPFLKQQVLYLLQIIPALIFVCFIPFVLTTIWIRFNLCKPKKPRFLFGPNPLINNKYWAIAMRANGYKAESWVWNYFQNINKKEDFDKVIFSDNVLDRIYMPFWAFILAAINFDIFVQSFRGNFLGKTFLAAIEPLLFKLMMKKTVIIPHGSDLYRYSSIEDTVRRHTLIADYPQNAKQSRFLEKCISRWTQHADCIIPGFLYEGLGRWDCIVFLAMSIDISSIKTRKIFSQSNGKKEPIKIVHAPNHRSIKGTEYIIDTVKKLQKNGFNIDFILLENQQNDVVHKILKTSDILIEQLHSGYALSGIEGMAYGNVVISNLEREAYTRPFRLFSFLNECPVVSSSVEDLEKTLIYLLEHPKSREKLGKLGQKYIQKYHSNISTNYLFSNIINKIWYKKQINLFDIYHPLKSEYCKKDRIETGLNNNKLIGVE